MSALQKRIEKLEQTRREVAWPWERRLLDEMMEKGITERAELPERWPGRDYFKSLPELITSLDTLEVTQ